MDRPQFTDKSDVFSFGVVALHVTTQEPPSVGLVIREGQPEIERRAPDLSRLPADHYMQPLILQCFQDDPSRRLRCREIMRSLLAFSVLETEPAEVSLCSQVLDVINIYFLLISKQ